MVVDGDVGDPDRQVRWSSTAMWMTLTWSSMTTRVTDLQKKMVVDGDVGDPDLQKRWSSTAMWPISRNEKVVDGDVGGKRASPKRKGGKPRGGSSLTMNGWWCGCERPYEARDRCTRRPKSREVHWLGRRWCGKRRRRKEKTVVTAFFFFFFFFCIYFCKFFE